LSHLTIPSPTGRGTQGEGVSGTISACLGLLRQSLNRRPTCASSYGTIAQRYFDAYGEESRGKHRSHTCIFFRRVPSGRPILRFTRDSDNGISDVPTTRMCSFWLSEPAIHCRAIVPSLRDEEPRHYVSAYARDTRDFLVGERMSRGKRHSGSLYPRWSSPDSMRAHRLLMNRIWSKTLLSSLGVGGGGSVSEPAPTATFP